MIFFGGQGVGTCSVMRWLCVLANRSLFSPFVFSWLVYHKCEAEGDERPTLKKSSKEYNKHRGLSERLSSQSSCSLLDNVRAGILSSGLHRPQGTWHQPAHEADISEQTLLSEEAESLEQVLPLCCWTESFAHSQIKAKGAAEPENRLLAAETCEREGEQ